MYALIGIAVLSVIASVLYRALGFNKVSCATCSDKLRERDALDHGGAPTAYTHYGICADRHAKIHAQMYYGGDKH